ncbi:MAG: ogr/Delta-like zinc finger family protein [Candidatus Lindowbacteria bacterium]|nr:ogr/Delta-like zinc finger family protein [Candidatus Lindowbacteria bacterium]
MNTEAAPACPHCGQQMKKWAVPAASSWDAEFHYVCFNDNCRYFVDGWAWMREKYQANASYRHCVDPASGCSRPLPVWSVTALKDAIIDNRNGNNSEKGTV